MHEINLNEYTELKKFDDNGDINIHQNGDIYWSTIKSCWLPIDKTYYGLPIWPTHPPIMRKRINKCLKN